MDVSLRSRWHRFGLYSLLVGSAAGLGGCGNDSTDGDLDTSPAGGAARQRPEQGDAEQAAVLLERARKAVAAVRRAEALVLYRQCLEADPAHLPALIELGYFLLEEAREHDPGGARDRFQDARALAPDDAAAMAGEGIAWAALGEIETARPLLLAAIERPEVSENPRRLALTESALGRVLHASHRSEEALEHYRAAVAAETMAFQRVGHRARLAELLFELGRLEPAEVELLAALEDDPEHVKSHYLLFRVLQRQGRDEEAAREQRIHELLRQLRDDVSRRARSDEEARIRTQRELVEAWPENPRMRMSLIRMLLEYRRWREADGEIAIEARARGGATAELFYLRARACAGQGDLAGAKQARDNMRQLNPNVPPQLDVTILKDWQKGRPDIDEATLQQTLRQWRSGS